MASHLSVSPAASAAGRPLTGRAVLLWLIGFFAVVFFANGILVRSALSTFAGLETESSYKAGLDFRRESDAAAKQASLGWKVSAHVANGAFRLEARDAAGQPISGLELAAVLHHPTDRRLDVVLDPQAAGAGVWVAEPVVPAGQWELMIDLTRDGERLFRSQNRVITR